MPWRERIESDPGILGGKPVIRGTRLSVEYVIDLLSQGWSADDVVRHHRNVTVEDVFACLAYALAILQERQARAMPA